MGRPIRRRGTDRLERKLEPDFQYSVASGRDRRIVLIAIGTLCALAWTYTINLATAMPSASMGVMVGTPNVQEWIWTDFVTMFAMWSVMMVAMMLPSATPMILLYANLARKRKPQSPPWIRIGLFISGYVLVWTGFSVVATAVNWGLHSGAHLTSMMGRATPLVGGIMLLAAGLYQWTSLKYACLANCRSPVGFLTSHWRNTTSAALEIGIRHGVFCFGCCWLLMALLFVLGVMNLVWIAALTVFVLLEKVVPRGQMISRVAGVLMFSWGISLVVTSLYKST